MSNRQKIYISLAVSAGVCSSIALLLYIRHRRKLNLSQTPDNNNNSFKAASFISSLQSHHDQQYTDITPSSNNNTDSQSITFQSGGATIGVNIPDGCISLTLEQAIVLTQYLDETNDDIERLHRILTNIANSATIQQSQLNLAQAGCIVRLRDILLTTTNEITKNKVLLALNNLALNENTIIHFSGITTIVIDLCRATPINSHVRIYGLNLLINMSVLEYLHDEYMTNIDKFNLLIKSTFENNDEMLSVGKILVNLSTNKSNLESLLKLTSIDFTTIVKICTLNKTSMKDEQISKLEDILLRYITFYCNVADLIIKQLQHNNDHRASWSIDAKSLSKNTLYFQLFDHEKQMLAKSIVRPQYGMNTINVQIKRFRQALDTIRQIQFESSVLSVHDEFNDDDTITSIGDFSTPRKFPETSTIFVDENNLESSFDDLAKDVHDQFEEDDTILADQSLNSFCSAYSTNETNDFTSPEKSILN